jgi:hypothetical protein
MPVSQDRKAAPPALLDAYLDTQPTNEGELRAMQQFLVAAGAKIGRRFEAKTVCKGALCKANVSMSPQEAAALSDMQVDTRRELLFFMHYGRAPELIIYASKPNVHLRDIVASYQATR